MIPYLSLISRFSFKKSLSKFYVFYLKLRMLKFLVAELLTKKTESLSNTNKISITSYRNSYREIQLESWLFQVNLVFGIGGMGIDFVWIVCES